MYEVKETSVKKEERVVGSKWQLTAGSLRMEEEDVVVMLRRDKERFIWGENQRMERAWTDSWKVSR